MSRTYLNQHDRVCARLMIGAEKDGWLAFDTNTKSPFDRGFIARLETDVLGLLITTVISKPLLVEVKTTTQERNRIALDGPQLEFREKVKNYQADYALVVLRVLKGAGKKAREERLFVYTDSRAVKERIERWWELGESMSARSDADLGKQGPSGGEPIPAEGSRTEGT